MIVYRYNRVIESANVFTKNESVIFIKDAQTFVQNNIIEKY